MATDIISLAGEPLLLEDADCDLHNWMSVYQSLDDLREFGAVPVAFTDQRRGSRSDTRGGTGLGIPNYPVDVPPRLNTLYWPSGATRWAYGLFLATGKTKDKIIAAAFPSDTSVPITLKMFDGTNTLQTDVYLLPPRPISAVRTPAIQGPDEELWLIPVVDFRFWLQFYNSGGLTVTPATTWTPNNGFPDVAITADAVPAAYLNPDPAELTRKYDSDAMLFDAIASSVGQRIIRLLDGTLKSVNATTSAAAVLANSNRSGTQIAGAGYSLSKGEAPEKITVAFPKWSWYVPWCDGDQISYDRSAPAGTVTKAGAKKPFHSTCYADFTGGSVTPDNDSVLSALATQIADDYYVWMGAKYDLTFNGLFPWEPTGHDNYVEWTLGRQLADGTRLAQTRVQSVPVDFGVSVNLSQDPSKVVLDHFQIARIVTPNNLPSGIKYATAQIYDHVAGGEGPKDDPPIAVQVWPWPATTTLPLNEYVWLLWNCEKNSWYALKPGTGIADLVRFELLEDKPFGIAARATRVDRNLAPVGAEITVIDTIGKWHGLALDNGMYGWAVHMPDNPNPLEYEIIFLEAPARFIEFVLTDYNADANGFAFTNGVARAIGFRQGNAFWGLSPNGIAGGENSLDIYDELGLFKRALPDAKGIAVYDERSPDIAQPRRGRYRAVICDQMSPLCKIQLKEKMCPDDGVAVVDLNSIQVLTEAPLGQSPRPVLVAQDGLIFNTVNGAAKSGKWIWFTWNETLLIFEVIQAQHVKAIVLLLPDGSQQSSQSNCNPPQIQQLEVAVMSCKDPTAASLFELVETTVPKTFAFSTVAEDCVTGSGSGSSVTAGSCALSLDITMQKICTFKRDAPPNEVPEVVTVNVATFTAVESIVDMYYSEELGCLYAQTAFSYSLCVCNGNLLEVFCSDLCASGSGSGSGS